jgi:hypothetical protein
MFSRSFCFRGHSHYHDALAGEMLGAVDERPQTKWLCNEVPCPADPYGFRAPLVFRSKAQRARLAMNADTLTELAMISWTEH